MDCQKCGFDNPDNARFCAGCGVKIDPVTCRQCNAENSPGSRFCNACGSELGDAGENKEPVVSSQAERRMLTVMFCDLVDSTVITERLDPEQTRDIIRKFQSLSKSIIDQFGGRITEYLGDGIVAQFTRHETNAERAVNAALAINDQLESANISIDDGDARVKVRCGIATGLAVVGDMLGDHRIRSESAIGLPLNLAARIQSLAEAGEVVMGEITQQLTRGMFDCEDLGLHTLKGIGQPQQVWRVIKGKSVRSRFLAHAAELTPMVDREEVLEALMSCWQNSTRGQAEALFFTGEAGIGKSRIIQEMHQIIAAEDHYYLEYQCAPYHTRTALYPLISRIVNVAGFEHGDSDVQRLAKLERLVERTTKNFERDMPAFTSLISLPGDERWPVPDLDPDERKEWIFSVLTQSMLELADARPLLIKIEDVHWIDPTTMELMERMIRKFSGHRVFLLITSRPGFSAGFVDLPQVSVINLEPLPERFTLELAKKIGGKHGLPDEVAREVIKRTGGIPLFIEELSKSLLERIGTADSATALKLLATQDIPATLHDSLVSRLDRLPEASRSIAQLAAVIGRAFSYGLLEIVSGYRDKNLYQALEPLLEAQLAFQQKAPPNAEFVFKHAMVRDAAYETLLQSDRVDIHKRIAETIEQDYPEILKNSPELVARHFTEGRDFNKAVQYWLVAGRRASENFALVEARDHLSTGLDCLKKIPETDESIDSRLDYLIALGTVLIALEGSGADATQEVYAQAVSLCDLLPASAKQFTALWGQWNISMDYSGDHSITWANRLESLSKQLDDPGLKLQAHHCQWTTLFHHGEFKQAYEHINNGVELYNPEQHRFHARTYGGHDPRVCGLGFLSNILWFLGECNNSSIMARRSRDHAAETGHTGSILHAIDFDLLLCQYKHDYQGMQAATEELDAFCEQQGLPEYAGKLMCCKGMVLNSQGEFDLGINLLEQGLEKLRKIGTLEDISLYTDYLSNALGKAQRVDEALARVDQTMQALQSYHLRYWHAELYRRKGVLFLQAGRNDQAVQAFLESLDIARRQSALILQLRTALDLYQYNQHTGLYPDGMELLVSIYKQFGKNEESHELAAARSILAC